MEDYEIFIKNVANDVSIETLKEFRNKLYHENKELKKEL